MCQLFRWWHAAHVCQIFRPLALSRCMKGDGMWLRPSVSDRFSDWRRPDSRDPVYIHWHWSRMATNHTNSQNDSSILRFCGVTLSFIYIYIFTYTHEASVCGIVLRRSEQGGTTSLLERRGITSRSCAPLSETSRKGVLLSLHLYFLPTPLFWSWILLSNSCISDLNPASNFARVAAGVTFVFWGAASSWEESFFGWVYTTIFAVSALNTFYVCCEVRSLWHKICQTWIGWTGMKNPWVATSNLEQTHWAGTKCMFNFAVI